MKRTAIIPARAGSKRLPNKNMKSIAGRPLIGWTIEAAKKSELFDEIIVSTDSKDVKNYSEEQGLSVPSYRPRHLCKDNTYAIEVILYHINKNKLDEVCYLQPTSPLRDSNDILESYKLFNEKKANAVISVQDLGIPFSWIGDPKDEFGNYLSQITTERSQDLRSAIVLNGAIYWFRSEAVIKYRNHLLSNDSYPYTMPREKSIDIDTLEDFMLAEFFMKRDLNS